MQSQDNRNLDTSAISKNAKNIKSIYEQVKAIQNSIV
jgi:hypothetical protein